MHALRLALPAVAALTLSGCQTVSFRRETGIPSTMHEQWHSSTLNGLIEVSDPVEPEAICDGDWYEVRTKETLGSGLVSAYVGTLWDPTGVEVICARPPKSKP